MRRMLCGLAVLAGSAALATPSHAQIPNNLNDPFYQYYSFFLPRQAAIASQPKVTDSINAVAAARAESSTIDRSGIYGGSSPFGLDALDPNSPSNRRSGGYARGSRMPTTTSSTNQRGGGDPRFFNRRSGFGGQVTSSAPVRRGPGGGGGGGMRLPNVPQPGGGIGGLATGGR